MKHKDISLDSLLKDVAACIVQGIFSRAVIYSRSKIEIYYQYVDLLEKSKVVEELTDQENASIFRRAGIIYSGILSSEGTRSADPETNLAGLLNYYRTLRDAERLRRLD